MMACWRRTEATRLLPTDAGAESTSARMNGSTIPVSWATRGANHLYGAHQGVASSCLSEIQDAARLLDGDCWPAAPLLLDAGPAWEPDTLFMSLASRDANALAATRSVWFGLPLLSPPTSCRGPKLSKPRQENVPTTR